MVKSFHTLIIVESPAKCKKIEEFLGDGYVVCASYGHFRKISSLEQITEEFKITFEFMKEKSKYLTALTKYMKEARNIIIATDDDREGEAIGWHICDHFKLPLTTPRILFNEISKRAILTAMQNQTVINMDIVYAQQARQVIDLLIGFKISPVLWEHVSRNNNLSAGRCQTPALHMVSENHRECESQIAKLVHKVDGYFTSKNICFQLSHTFDDEQDALSFIKLSQSHDHIFSSDKSTNISIAPPKPLITSSIQQECSNRFHMSPKETMKICQHLYEEGYITYMRTDSRKYSPEFIQLVVGCIVDKYGASYIGDSEQLGPITKGEESCDNGVQEAHEAIRITQLAFNKLSDEQFTKREQSVYHFIYNHTFKTCMAKCVMEQCVCSVTSPMTNILYKHKPRKVRFAGWKIIEGVEDDEYYGYLTRLKTNQKMKYSKISTSVHVSQTKTHYTEARIIQRLEEEHIGRPSTYASIIDKLFSRNYVCKGDVEGQSYKVNTYVIEDGVSSVETNTSEKMFQVEHNKVIVQPMGLSVDTFLYTFYDSLFNYTFTRDMEASIDDIAVGKRKYVDVCREFKQYIAHQMAAQKSIISEKQRVMIDNKYECLVAKYGIVLKEQNDDKVVFHKVKKTFTMEDIRSNQTKYTFESLVDKSGKRVLGEYKGNDVELRNGPYGHYIFYDGRNIRLSNEQKQKHSIDSMNLATVIDILDDESKTEKKSSVLRVFDDKSNNISIREGKYGPYIFYKTKKMKSAKFIGLSSHDVDVEMVDKKRIMDIISNEFSKPKTEWKNK